jgi:hypothetical protein
MRCANPECRSDLSDQSGGSFRLMELEVSEDERIETEDNGFPVRTLPTKYFWLCVECNQKFVLSHWTPSGVVLLPRQPCTSYGTTMQAEMPTSGSPSRGHVSPRREPGHQEMV